MSWEIRERRSVKTSFKTPVRVTLTIYDAAHDRKVADVARADRFNAQMLVAAPELIAALRRCVACLPTPKDVQDASETGDLGEPHLAAEEARRILTKALPMRTHS